MSGHSGHRRVLVVGAGLMGTSVALAARASGLEVWIADADPARVATAVSLGAGVAAPWPTDDHDNPADLVVVATPPAAIGSVAVAALHSHVSATVTHVGSVQEQPQQEVEASGADLSRYIGSHPIAGSELSGPAHADAGLFADRPWILCPTTASGAEALDQVTAFAEACGARPAIMAADRHDRVFAHLSHVPQLVASALAASLQGADPADVALAGPGIRDTTRLADSDPDLWSQIIAANREPVAAALLAVAQPLQELAAALAGDIQDVGGIVRELIRTGNAGRNLLPGKHGGAPTRVTSLLVSVPDEPGALARLLDAVAAERVNLEDLRVEHAPGQQVGIAELAVHPDAAERLTTALSDSGWTVRSAATGAL